MNAIPKQPTVNSLNFVVDSLLHALQVVKYSWSLHREARSLWTWIADALINIYDISKLILMIGFTFVLPLNIETILMFETPFILGWLIYIYYLLICSI